MGEKTKDREEKFMCTGVRHAAAMLRHASTSIKKDKRNYFYKLFLSSGQDHKSKFHMVRIVVLLLEPEGHKTLHMLI